MPVPVEEVCKDLDLKYKKILLSRKNSNHLIELMKFVHSNDKQQVRVHACKLLTSLFSHYFQNGELSSQFKESSAVGVEVMAEIKFKSWLYKQYKSFCESLADNLDSNRSDREKNENLEWIFQLIKSETLATKNQDGELQFSFDLFHATLDKILSSVENLSLVKKLCKYLAFSDLRYFCLRHIHENLEENKSNATFIENLINLLSLMPGLVKDDKENTKKLYALPEDQISEGSKMTCIDSNRKIFSDCVFKMLDLHLNTKLFKKILIKFPEKLLPKMSNPLMCTDFLNESYKLGGLVSILSLNSLYVLISRYNIEIPEFYKKLYSQLNASIFHTKYKSRFFALLDTCLSSTHLSVFLVGVFIKRISRLLLFAPACDTKILLRFITNLIVRNPSCKPLLHRGGSTKLVDTDPYDVHSNDLNQTAVMNSAVWEIQAISNHYSPDIAQDVKELNSQPTQQTDVYELLDTNDYESMMEVALKKHHKNCSLVYVYDNNAYKNGIFSS